MTLNETLESCRKIKPNRFDDATLIGWVADLEQLIIDDIFSSLASPPVKEFERYTVETPRSQKLLVPEPYADVYLHYLFAQIDYNNSEIGKYANSRLMFDAAWSRCFKYFVRRFSAKKRQWVF